MRRVVVIRRSAKTGVRVVFSPNKKAGAPKSARVPPKSTYDPKTQRVEHTEAEVTRCELLMIRGVKERRLLAETLNISLATADDYMRRVRARWSVSGSEKNLHQYRGEQLTRLDDQEREIWEKVKFLNLFKESPRFDHKAFVSQMALILQLNRQRAEMVGLTPHMIEQIVQSDAVQPLDFGRNKGTHELAARLFSTMAVALEKRLASQAKVIEHDGDGAGGTG